MRAIVPNESQKLSVNTQRGLNINTINNANDHECHAFIFLRNSKVKIKTESMIQARCVGIEKPARALYNTAAHHAMIAAMCCAGIHNIKLDSLRQHQKASTCTNPATMPICNPATAIK